MLNWKKYTGGADIHYHCDTESGFFLDFQSERVLSPGEEFSFHPECVLPYDGEYVFQFDFLSEGMKLTINGVPLNLWFAVTRNGILPEIRLSLKKGKNTLAIQLTNTEKEKKPLPHFRLRVVDREGNVVRQNAVIPYGQTLPVPGKLRAAPSLEGFRPGAGKGFRSVGRFGYTKGDGLLDYTVAEFGRISKPHVCGHPRYDKNLIWGFSVLPEGFESRGSLLENYQPGPGEEITADWSGVHWTQRQGNSFFTLEYSLIAPELLIRCNQTGLRLSGLCGSAACRRVLLPLSDGISDRVDDNGVFYDRSADGPLAENWILFYDNGAFPEIPVLLILRTSPEQIRVTRNAKGNAEEINLNFKDHAEWAMIGFPHGIAMFNPVDLNSSWLENTISLCRNRSRTALARPSSCEEYFRLEKDRVKIIQKFRTEVFSDVFGTVPKHYAPYPPPLALAAPSVPEVKLESGVSNFNLPTKYGPLFAVMDSDWSEYSIPVPETRRDFALSEETPHAFASEFKAYLDFHDGLKEIPNPGVHQFLFPFAVPLLTFAALSETEKETLISRLRKNLEFVLNPDSSYTGPRGRHCYTWYERKEPFSGISYWMNYLHVGGIFLLPDCEKETVSTFKRPFIEVDWGNGIGLYSIWLAALLSNGWDVLSKRKETLRRAFDYYLGTMDWACLCSAYCENGRAWSDGTNYGGYLGYVNIMRMLGLKEEYETGVYAFAKMAAERMGLFLASQKYICRYFDSPPWYVNKLFPEELDGRNPELSVPSTLIHNGFREQGIYNMTTEGHYPETFAMYARFFPEELPAILSAMEKSQSDGRVVGPLKDGAKSVYHSNGEQFGEQEIYSYILLCRMSGRYSEKELLGLIDEAARNERLSTDYLGAHTFSYRRVPESWVPIYLREQVRHPGQPRLTRWRGVSFGKTAFPELEVRVLEGNAWLEIRSKTPVKALLNGIELAAEADGEFYRFAIPEPGVIRFKV